MSRNTSLTKLTYLVAPLKTPNIKEIVVGPNKNNRNDVTPQQPILMDEYGQTPDHYYLAKKPPASFFQVKRKLDLQSISTKEAVPKEDTRRNSKTKQRRKFNINKRKVKKVVEKPRYDTSLGRLTTKFLKLLLKSKDGAVNLNDACTLLSVPKRRLYDITNVLEGAGLVAKRSRNFIQWLKGGLPSLASASSIKRQLQKEIDILESKENILDELIYFMKTEIDAFTESNSEYRYVTNEDIQTIEDLSEKLVIGLESTTSVDIVKRDDKSLLVSSSSSEMEPLMLLGKLSFDNILPLKSSTIDDSCKIRIQSNIVLHKAIKEEPVDDDDPTGENEETTEIKVEVKNPEKSDVSYDESQRRMWTEGDIVIKNAFISEEDDMAPTGKHLLLQTEDQNLDMLPFSPLQIAADDYSFLLDDGEGLTDLFDCDFTCA